MHKKIAAVGLAALLTVGSSAHAFAQQQQPGTATQAPTSQQTNQSREDDDFPWGLRPARAGVKRRDHEVRRDDRTTDRHAITDELVAGRQHPGVNASAAEGLRPACLRPDRRHLACVTPMRVASRLGMPPLAVPRFGPIRAGGCAHAAPPSTRSSADLCPLRTNYDAGCPRGRYRQCCRGSGRPAESAGSAGRARPEHLARLHHARSRARRHVEAPDRGRRAAGHDLQPDHLPEGDRRRSRL